MSAREVVATLDGRRLDAAKRAHGAVQQAERIVQEAVMNLQIARAQLADGLVLATGEDGKDLRFDPERGQVYREISTDPEPAGGES